jgi:hypothetical protein
LPTASNLVSHPQVYNNYTLATHHSTAPPAYIRTPKFDHTDDDIALAIALDNEVESADHLTDTPIREKRATMENRIDKRISIVKPLGYFACFLCVYSM